MGMRGGAGGGGSSGRPPVGAGAGRRGRPECLEEGAELRREGSGKERKGKERKEREVTAGREGERQGGCEWWGDARLGVAVQDRATGHAASRRPHFDLK